MTGARVTFEANTDQVDRVLDAMLDFGHNPYEFLDEVGGQLATSTQDRFDAGVGPDGKAWKTSQRAASKGGKTLIDDGHLVGSITHDATSDYVDVGSDQVYAAIHQFGGNAGRGGFTVIEARPFLGVSDQDEKMIEDTAFEFLEYLQ